MTSIDSRNEKRIRFRLALAAGFLAILAAGCEDTRLRLGPVGGPGIVAPAPLAGQLTVMLPYDVRPSLEHEGSTPGLESFIYLVFVTIETDRGNYVTSDGNFRVPYDDKEGPSKFGTDPSVAAAVGEDAFDCLQNARLFEGVTRLHPAGNGKTWVLVDKANAPTRIVSGPAELMALNSTEQEAQDLDLRAQATPLPSFSTEWLMRIRILHLYGCCYSDSTETDVYAAGPNNTTYTYSQRNTKNYQPSANAVLGFDLYHNTPGGPVLMWQRTVSGNISYSNGSNTAMTVQALSAALDKMVKSLIADLPVIRARVDSSQRGPGSVSLGS